MLYIRENVNQLKIRPILVVGIPEKAVGTLFTLVIKK